MPPIRRRPRVLVVGAGVIGLSCAVRLAESGFDVHVLARDKPLETTSAVAAALWYPYRAAPVHRVTEWARSTYDELLLLADRDPEAGVAVREGIELLREPRRDPEWAAIVPTFARMGPARRPPGWSDGWRFCAPVVDMSAYLPWLVRRLEDAGGTLTRATLLALPAAPLVVNCSGVAARALARDPTVVAVRGQVVLLEQVGIEQWLLADAHGPEPTYVVPRRREIVVGGTATEGDWQREPDEETARRLLARAVAIEPKLAGARVLGTRVGLRPGRPAVRLEAERHDGGSVVHCYGHGGAGVTLSWGCADEVCALVGELTGQRSG